jgi:hypothetical protein
MADIKNIDDYKIAIGGENFSLLEIPSVSSELVKMEKKNVLQTIRLDQLVAGLRRTGDFINLAYNSTPAKYGEIRAPIGRIHHRFSVLCGKCTLQMDIIKKATEDLLPNFSRVFKYLVDGRDEMALTFLARASGQAMKLADSMESLVKDFERLADDSADALAISENARGTELKNAQELKTRAQDLEARIAEAEELSKKLAQSRQELEKLYAEAQKKAEKSEDRAFALSLVGAILTPIAQGVGAFAGAYTNARNPGAAIPPDVPPKAPGEDGDELTQKKNKAGQALDNAKVAESKSTAVLDSAKQALKVAEDKVAAAASAVKEADEGESRKAAVLKQEKAQADLLAVKQDLESAESASKSDGEKTQAAKTAFANASKALSEHLEKLGGKLGQEGRSYESVAEGYRQEKLKYLDLLMQKKDKEIEVSANLQKYAVEMKNAHAQEMTAELTAKALFNVIAALKQVVVVLRDTTLFWSHMAAHCKRLADPNFVVEVELMKSASSEVKHDLYTDPQFKKEVVHYLAGWVALGQIAQDYMLATDQIRIDVDKDYGTYLGDEGARQVAAELGERLLGQIQSDVTAANADKQLLADEKARTRQNAPAAPAANERLAA